MSNRPCSCALCLQAAPLIHPDGVPAPGQLHTPPAARKPLRQFKECECGDLHPIGYTCHMEGLKS